jgi:hypothetical protein
MSTPKQYSPANGGVVSEATEAPATEAKPLTIYQRLQLARKLISSTELKKAGWNDYSKYAYFTPEQVEKLVSEANEEVGIIAFANLKADEYGYYQELTLINEDDTSESLTFQLRTERGELKATNAAQQMGGTDTFSERYLKQKTYLIKDNTLDPDSQDNRKAAQMSGTVGTGHGIASNAAQGLTPSGAPNAATKRTEAFQKAQDSAEYDVPTIVMDEDEII